MFVRLAQASINYNTVAIRSSDTLDRYHIYKSMKLAMNHHASLATPSALPFSHHFTWEIPLHDVEIQFASDSATSPMINALYFSFFSDYDYTSAAFADTVYMTSDLCFRDKQL